MEITTLDPNFLHLGLLSDPQWLHTEKSTSTVSVWSQHRHYHWSYRYLKTAGLRNKIIYWQNFRHQANLTLTNTPINIFSVRKLCTQACIKIYLKIPQYPLTPSIRFRVIPNIPFSSFAYPLVSHCRSSPWCADTAPGDFSGARTGSPMHPRATHGYHALRCKPDDSWHLSWYLHLY